MTPSTAKLIEWAQPSADGSTVTLPAPAWESVLWMLGLMEKIEDNKHVQAALRKAAA